MITVPLGMVIIMMTMDDDFDDRADDDGCDDDGDDPDQMMMDPMGMHVCAYIHTYTYTHTGRRPQDPRWNLALEAKVRPAGDMSRHRHSPAVC